MAVPPPGAIDCDVHVALPGLNTVLPYLSEYWREHVLARGLQLIDYTLAAFPPGLALFARPDWKIEGAFPGSSLEKLQKEVLDGFGLRHAICNVIHGAQCYFNEDLSAAICGAVNDWIAAEWLDKDSRLRASIVVPMHSPEQAAKEIARKASDRRFVQVLMIEMGEIPLGRRLNWPIYREAEKHDLPIAIHAGSTGRHAPTSIGWPTYYVQDYIAYSTGFAAVLNSLIGEGVFDAFPKLKVVLLESGVTWLPSWMWRANKAWRGMRREVPWLKMEPSEYARKHVRVSLQPFDGPPSDGQLKKVLDQIACDDMILFSSDYPHWHYDGFEAIPAGLSDDLVRKITQDNPLNTYGSRLAHGANAQPEAIS